MLVLVAAAVVPLAAQQPTRAAGRVVRSVGADSVGVAGVRVLLHRIAQDAQGAVDTTTTAADGGFAVRFPADTTAIFLLSARYAGLEYFSFPLPTDPSRPDTSVVIVVADTSAAQPVSVGVRQLVITAPEPDGTRDVLDLIQVVNPGPHTRVGRDTLAPSWAMPLPPGIMDFHVGPGDVGPDAVQRQGDALAVLAPLPPGPKQFLVQYALPGGVNELRLPLADTLPTLEILLEESGASVAGGRMERSETRDVEGRTFHLWAGSPPAGVVAIVLPPTGVGARRALLALVAAFALVLAAAGWYIRRRAAEPPRPPAEDPDPTVLADAAAQLDARYAGREAETPSGEWKAYLEERARLKAAIMAALAARTRRP